jgi:hypothetical protein
MALWGTSRLDCIPGSRGHKLPISIFSRIVCRCDVRRQSLVSGPFSYLIESENALLEIVIYLANDGMPIEVYLGLPEADEHSGVRDGAEPESESRDLLGNRSRPWWTRPAANQPTSAVASSTAISASFGVSLSIGICERNQCREVGPPMAATSSPRPDRRSRCRPDGNDTRSPRL